MAAHRRTNQIFPQQRKLGVFSHSKGPVGAAKIRIAKVSRFPGTVPRKVPKPGSQARFPSKVPKQGSRFPKARFLSKVPKKGSQAKFPSKVP